MALTAPIQTSHPSTVWTAIIGLLLLLIGTIADFLGVPELAGFLGMYGIAILLFALIAYCSLFALKKTAPLFMETGSQKGEMS